MTLLERLRRVFLPGRHAEEEAAARAAFPARVAHVLRSVPGVLSAVPSGALGVRVGIAQGLAYELDLEDSWERMRARPPADVEAWVRDGFVACMKATPPLDMAAFEEFEASLARIPWFENVGRPLEPGVARLRSWEEWSGPCSDAVEAVDLSGLRSVLRGTGPELDAWHPLMALFQRVAGPVYERCSRKLGDDPPGADPEVPPRFAAASTASWIAALVGLHLACRREPPPELAAQWEWFRRGHWPAEAVLGGDAASALEYRIY